MSDLAYRHITIEGVIGAGKTTLSKLLATDYNGQLLLENFKDNPYLKNFYEDPAKHAFPLELYFMAERYQQQRSMLHQMDLFEQLIFTDYAFFKSIVFANITLENKDDLRLFRMLFNIIQPNISAPEIILYLYKNTDALLENIKKRGRSYEQTISKEYLSDIHEQYISYFKQQNQSAVLIIDTTEMDFVSNPLDYKQLKSYLSVKYAPGIYYL